MDVGCRQRQRSFTVLVTHFSLVRRGPLHSPSLAGRGPAGGTLCTTGLATGTVIISAK